MNSLNRKEHYEAAHSIWRQLYQEYVEGARAGELAEKYDCSEGHVYRVVRKLRKEIIIDERTKR
jgi:Mor family transcriptional regulator